MRVISGYYRGRKLECIEGWDIRPTSDRVKGSLFNIFGNKVYESRFLDLFGGTGAIGIEALSRGAGRVAFVDQSAESIKVLRKNLEQLGIREKAEVYQMDFMTAIERLYHEGCKFDLIFIDPPYKKTLCQQALSQIDKQCILEDDGMIVVEHDVGDKMPEQVGQLQMQRQKKYGSTLLSFYTTSNAKSIGEAANIEEE